MRIAILGVVLLGLASPSAVAGITDPHVLVHGGLVIPTAPNSFADRSNLGFGGGIGLGLTLISPLVILGQVDFTTFGLDEAGYRKLNPDISAGSRVRGGEISLVYASLGLRLNLPAHPASIRPYLIAGAGYFRYAGDAVNVDGTERGFRTEDTTGVHGGGGLDVLLGPFMHVFFEAVFIAGFTDTDSTGYLPVRTGIVLPLGKGF